MEKAKYIVKFLISLIAEPEQTWRYLSDKDSQESKVEYMNTNYYLPMMGVIAALIFLLKGWASPFNLEIAIKGAFIFAGAYFAGPYLAEFVLQKIFKRAIDQDFDKDKMMIFVSYNTSYLMLVELVSATFPGIRFISFSALYMFYLVWLASDILLGIPEKIRWKFSVISAVVIWGAPFVIEEIMAVMIRY